MVFEETSKKITVKKDTNIMGYIELAVTEKSFTSYGSRKFLDNEIVEIKDYLDTHHYPV